MAAIVERSAIKRCRPVRVVWFPAGRTSAQKKDVFTSRVRVGVQTSAFWLDHWADLQHQEHTMIVFGNGAGISQPAHCVPGDGTSEVTLVVVHQV